MTISRGAFCTPILTSTAYVPPAASRGLPRRTGANLRSGRAPASGRTGRGLATVHGEALQATPGEAGDQRHGLLLRDLPALRQPEPGGDLAEPADADREQHGLVLRQVGVLGDDLADQGGRLPGDPLHPLL